MKKQITLVFSMLLVVISLFAQRETIKLNFTAVGSQQNLPVSLDSVFIVNNDLQCDTVLSGTGFLELQWFEGIEDFSRLKSFGAGPVFPNPSEGVSNCIFTLQQKKRIKVQLVNESGKILANKSMKLRPGKHLFKITTGQQGVYLLRFSSGNESKSAKLTSVKTISPGLFAIDYMGTAGDVENFKASSDYIPFYFKPGNRLSYTVYAHGFNNASGELIPDKDTVIDVIVTPNLLDFTADVVSGTPPLRVEFSPLTTYQIDEWYWDFGDGDTSSLQNPVHVYQTPDSYFDVTLHVVDVEGVNHTVTKENFIHAFQQAAYVDFTADYTEGFAPQTVHFFCNTNIQNPNYYGWNFGDGETAVNVENPYHEYLTPGVYTVTLTVANDHGSKQETKENFITIGTCPVTVTDFEGHTYETLHIGNQCWMKQNMNLGQLLTDVNENGSDNGIIEKHCYDNDEDNCDEYGGLYTYSEAIQYDFWADYPRGICPLGWHVPTANEWQQLVSFLGGESVAGGKMKEWGYEHWDEPNTGATNSSGFSARGAGYIQDMLSEHIYEDFKKSVFFLTANNTTTVLLYGDRMAFTNVFVNINEEYSVRCIKNKDDYTKPSSK